MVGIKAMEIIKVNDLKLSQMGLGCMNFGSKTCEKTSFSILDEYVSSGGNFIDTANNYAFWQGESSASERVIGKWLKSRKYQVNVATKIGANPKRELSDNWLNDVEGLSKTAVFNAVDKSLKNLQVDCLQICYLHIDDPFSDIEETIFSIKLLQNMGKINYLAFSNFTPNRLLIAQKLCEVLSVKYLPIIQQGHTYLKPNKDAFFGHGILQANDELLEFCKKNSWQLVAYSPLLAGAYENERKRDDTWQRFSKEHYKVEKLQQVSDETGQTINAIIYRYLMQKKSPALPLLAASNVGQLTENLKAVRFELTQEQMHYLN